MKWFRKKKDEFLDYTQMHKRRLPSKPKEGMNKEKVIDYSGQGRSDLGTQRPVNPQPPGPQQGNEADASGLGFLSNLAGVQGEMNAERPITDNIRSASKATIKAKFNEMKLKIDDNEFKIRQLESKIQELEEQLKRFQVY